MNEVRKGRDFFMFMNKKLKATVAAISAAASVIVNMATAAAAPYGYKNTDDVRNKALSRYLSTNSLLAMVNTQAPTVIDDVKNMAADGLVVYGEESITETVGYNTIKRINASLEAGETITVREGAEGEKTVTYKVKYENGAEVSREVVSECVTRAPVDKIVEYGAKSSVVAATQTSVDTGKLDYKYVIECKATAYDMSAEENGGYAGQTATGVPLDKGVIAVDPKVIPLGSRVYVESLDGSWTYGYAVAADTGGAIKGNRVDLCYRTQYECRQFGVRQCRVYVLN